jgi:hypothetical protein
MRLVASMRRWLRSCASSNDRRYATATVFSPRSLALPWSADGPTPPRRRGELGWLPAARLRDAGPSLMPRQALPAFTPQECSSFFAALQAYNPRVNIARHEAGPKLARLLISCLRSKIQNHRSGVKGHAFAKIHRLGRNQHPHARRRYDQRSSQRETRRLARLDVEPHREPADHGAPRLISISAGTIPGCGAADGNACVAPSITTRAKLGAPTSLRQANSCYGWIPCGGSGSLNRISASLSGNSCRG